MSLVIPISLGTIAVDTLVISETSILTASTSVISNNIVRSLVLLFVLLLRISWFSIIMLFSTVSSML